MAQTKLGAMKITAQKAGVSLDEYKSMLERGMKWCYKCRQFRQRSDFNIDRSRGDGLAAVCKPCTHVLDPYASLRGRVSTFKGHTHTDDAKRRMSEQRRGKPGPRKGVPRTPEVRAKISISVIVHGARGPAHYAWKDGSTQRNLVDRRTVEYKNWRQAVFARDHFTCQKCGDASGGNLRAHHIRPYADYPDLRFDVANGITLCHRCHELEHYKPDSIRNLRKAKRGRPLY